jgi:ribosomal protein S18 acetylase RimI-like enzyme
MKNDLDNPTIRKLVSESAYDQSNEATDRRMEEFRRREDLHLYGWLENDEILGACGVEIHSDCVIINNIAVDPKVRKRGIGKSMITSIQQKYKQIVKAETDDEAVRFYQKCGFEIEKFIKTYNTDEYQRYKCVLHF